MSSEKLITDTIDSLLRHEITKRFAIVKIMAIRGKVTPKTLKERREFLRLSMTKVSKELHMSTATIWKAEKGAKVALNCVKKLNDFYLSKGV